MSDYLIMACNLLSRQLPQETMRRVSVILGFRARRYTSHSLDGPQSSRECNRLSRGFISIAGLACVCHSETSLAHRVFGYISQILVSLSRSFLVFHGKAHDYLNSRMSLSNRSCH